MTTTRLNFVKALASFAIFSATATFIEAKPSKVAPPPPLTPIRIVLVGDSTVATGGGWGPGFQRHLKPPAQCINLAQPGRSSKSFRNEGWWEKALNLRPDYILIQFGHNDMPGKGPKRETDAATTYREYLSRYIKEARSIGAKPIIVTSMTRRHFKDDGKIHSDLTAYVEAAKKVAAKHDVPVVDLHARSLEMVNRMGPAAAAPLDREPRPGPKFGNTAVKAKPDKTHLSAQGSEVFGKVVADELKKADPGLGRYIN